MEGNMKLSALARGLAVWFVLASATFAMAQSEKVRGAASA